MPEVNEGQHVVPKQHLMGNTPMMETLKRRTGLSADELASGRIKVRRIDEEGHAVMAHPDLTEPFICHSKFFEPAPQR